MVMKGQKPFVGAVRFFGKQEEGKNENPLNLDMYTIPEKGIGQRSAYELIHGEMELNFRPATNMATFVTTWIDDEARKLAYESLDINFIDRAEYPMTTEIHKRDVWMTAKMLHAEIPDEIEDKDFIGTGTVGSSEAVMLAMLAHKERWKLSDYGDKSKPPNIVIGGAYQICWEKVFKFFEIEPRIIPVVDGIKCRLTFEDIDKAYRDGLIDKNTITIATICGTTFTGEIDEIFGINDLVRRENEKRLAENKDSFLIPIHVDAASGGFILPFTSPKLEWDFRLSQVQSINLSNHKYGLVGPGMGTVIFRKTELVPEDLFTKVNYLGGEINDYALSFSRGSWQVIAQYYNYLCLGYDGYSQIMEQLIDLSSTIAASITTKYGDWFELKTHPSDVKKDDLKNNKGEVIQRLLFPVIVFDISKAPFSADALSDRLKQDGWFIPAYPYPHPEKENTPAAENAESVLLRIVIRENFSEFMAERLLQNLYTAVSELTEYGVPPQRKGRTVGHGILC